MRQLRLQCRQKVQICICCVCGEVRDDISGDGSWKRLRDYQGRHGFVQENSVISHTFCPPCFMAYKALLGLDATLTLHEPAVV
jgi:hypothetical protein